MLKYIVTVVSSPSVLACRWYQCGDNDVSMHHIYVGHYPFFEVYCANTICTMAFWESCLLFLLGDFVIITMFSNFSICGSVCVWTHSLQILKLYANLKPTRVALRFKIKTFHIWFQPLRVMLQIKYSKIYLSVKGKVHPITCHEGTKVESTLYLTSAFDWGG
jgi:hypothetical protein